MGRTSNNIRNSPGTALRAQLVGRERELVQLRGGLQDAVAGHGRMFLISGEPGIGKTRLAEQISAEASQDGLQVVWARCWEGGGAPAYWPIIQILRGCAERPDFPGVLEALGDGIDKIASLVPELVPRTHTREQRSEAERSDPEQARFRLFDAVARFISGLAASQPMLLLVDDLHDADTGALQMLSFVARALKDAPVLLVGTHREAEVERSPELRSQITELARESDLLRLGGLSLADTTELVRSRTGVAPHERLISALHEATEGNPLFLSGLVQMLASEGKLDREQRLTAADLKLPANVRGAIDSRLSKLPQHVSATLRAAAVLGVEFDIAPLGRVVDAPTDQVLQRLDEAVDSGVIEPVPTSSTSFRFTHPLIRSVIYDAISATERAQLHKQTGEALEATVSDRSAHLAQIANHFRLAVLSGTAEKAITYSIRAAESALAVFAYADAATLLREALLLCDGHDSERKADVLQRLGTVTCFSLNRDEGIRYLEAALSLYKESGNEQKVAELNTALGLAFAPFSPRMNIPRALAHFREAQSWTGERTDYTASGWLYRGMSIAFFEALRIDEALVAVDRAMRTFERNSDSAWVSAAAFRAQLLMVKGRHREAVELLDRVSGVAQITADPETFRSTMWSAGWYRMLMRDPREARRLFTRGMERPALSLQQRADNLEFLALTELIMGDLFRAKALAAENRVNAVFRSRIELREGHWETAKELLLGFLEWSRGAGTRWCEEDTLSHLVEVLRITGDLERADKFLRQALRLYEPNDLFWEMRNRPQAALLAIEIGHPEEAPRHLEVCRAILAHGEDWLGLAGFAARAEGALAAVEGRSMTIHFQNAMAIFKRFSLRWDEADTLYEWGRALNAVGEYSDAHQKFDAAVQIYRCHGAGQRWIDRVDAARQSVADSRARSIDSPGPAIFRKEGEFWTLAYRGATFRLKDVKGLAYIAYLLAHPGERIHVHELVARVDGVAVNDFAISAEVSGELSPMSELGDAGAALDRLAQTDYRQRLRELAEEVAEAERLNDTGRSERLRREQDFLSEELSAAVGIGGRERKASAHVERARGMVSKSIRAGLEKIRNEDASLGRYFAASIKTGYYCAYLPDPERKISWQL